MPSNDARMQMVGIDSRIEAVTKLLKIESDDVRMVGITGLGGIGKTTIAKAIYYSFSNHFKAKSFVENVREGSKTEEGKKLLQQTLLKGISKDKNLSVDTLHEGSTRINKILRLKKALIILDDVDDADQIETLLGQWKGFAVGSRIILTTRDKSLLVQNGPSTYDYGVEGLDKDEAIELFRKHAFPSNEVSEDYLELEKQAISYAKGLPLALKVMGRDLCEKPIDYWEDALDCYKTNPLKGIQNILKRSYEGLTENEKNIFLDIACFFKGYDMSYNMIKDVLKACGLNPVYVIQKLIDKCLIDQYNYFLSMHDLLQQMGMDIVRQEALQKPGERSRLWCYEEALDVLTEDMGSDKIRSIILWPPNSELVEVQIKAQFCKMKNLRLLLIRNVCCRNGPLVCLPNKLSLLDWHGYPFSSWPPNFFPKKLVVLNMPHSRLKEPLNQNFVSVTYVDFSGCNLITKIPDLSMTTNVTTLKLVDCTNLIEIDDSVGRLDKLEVWDLNGCIKLETLPNCLTMKFLTYVDFSRCNLITKIPDLSMTPNVTSLILARCTNLVEIDDSVGRLDKLVVWDLNGCIKLETLPNCLTMKSLTYVDFSRCNLITKIPDFSMTPNVTSLILARCTNLVEIDDSVGHLDKLEELDLYACEKLETLPNCLTMKSLTYFDLEACESIKKFPNILHKMKGVTDLHLQGNYTNELPPSFGNLIGLEGLLIELNSGEAQLPGSIYNLQHIKWLDFSGNVIFPKNVEIDRQPMCKSHGCSSKCVFPMLIKLCFSGNEICSDIEFILNYCCLLTLEELEIYESKVVTLPESMSRCERLHTLIIKDCGEFREILRLPHSIRRVRVVDCQSLDLQSFFQPLPEIIGLPPNLPPCLGVTSHMLKFPHSSTVSGEQIRLCEYIFEATGDENDIPNWFNHQRDGNLISFLIGPEFPTIALCVAFGIQDEFCELFYDVFVSINGSERTFVKKFIEIGESVGHLCFSCRPQSSLQELFRDLPLTDRNHVEILCETFHHSEIVPTVERIGVHVECNCPPPQNQSGLGLHIPKKKKGLGLPMDTENGSDLGLAFDSSYVYQFALGSSSVAQPVTPQVKKKSKRRKRKVTPQSSLQAPFRDLKLTDRNHVEILSETFDSFHPTSGDIAAPIVERIGVHVECNCPPPQNPSIFQDVNRHLSLQLGLGLPMDTENGSDLGVTGSAFTASKHLHPLMLKSLHDPDFAADKANTQSKASQSQATPLPPNNPFEEVLWPTMRAKLDANPTTQAHLQNNDFVRIMREFHNTYLEDKRVIQAPTSADAEMPQSLSSLSLRERKRGMKAEPAEELDLMQYIEQPQHDPDFATDKVAQPPVNDDFDSNQFPLWERMGRLLIGLFLMVLLILSIGWL